MTARQRRMHASSESFGSWPQYSEDEIAAVKRVLESGKVNYWTGDEVRHFEREYAKHLSVRNAIALANGSVALDIPLRHWGIGPEDEVIVTPRSFIASASCVALRGARPVFADVDLDSGNISASTIEPLITKKTKAIIPVHLGGWPCEMDGINALADSWSLKVLEDCAQAHGAAYNGRQVGSLADAATFSFCQDKIISTGGEGGLLATNDSELWDAGWSFKDHGKTWESVYERKHGVGFRWQHDRLGTNLRLTEMQAAIGRIQLRKVGRWLETRRKNAEILTQRLAVHQNLRIPQPPANHEHAYYKFYVYVHPERLRSNWSRDRILTEIVDLGAPCFTGSCSEMYLEKAFSGIETLPSERLPNARLLGETSLMFPVHPTLTPDMMNKLADIAGSVLQAALR